jgi:2-keto-4-pentenoate hydratase
VDRIDIHALALELTAAFSEGRTLSTPPSHDGLDLSTAYAVERELVRMRRSRGHETVGVKVGYANKAIWRALKLETLVWAHMYDDTVRDADANAATFSLAHTISPKIEPEIVFKMKAPLGAGTIEAAAALESVEWLALGFEIIDCPYADWKLQPADFVAAYGLRGARRRRAASDHGGEHRRARGATADVQGPAVKRRHERARTSDSE